MVENVDQQAVEPLILLYSRKNKSGGDKIVEHKYDDKRNILKLTYENASIAKRVADFGKVEFKKRTYQAKFWEHEKKNKPNHSNNAKKEDRFVGNAIMIENVRLDEMEIVKALFSDEDEIEKFELIKEKNLLVIHYKNQEIAQNVIKSGPKERKKKIFEPKIYCFEDQSKSKGNF